MKYGERPHRYGGGDMKLRLEAAVEKADAP
jgi:hypothetical protein